MTSNNVNNLERVASMGIAERDLNHSSSIDYMESEKKIPIFYANHDATQKPLDVETVDASQPAGVMKMEAITLVWTKKWLITAYTL